MRTLVSAIKFKRLWLAMSVAAVVALFAAVGGVAAAGTGGQESLIPRVAEILQIDEQTVADAFSQARKDATQAWLDALVESGRITQEQADEVTAASGERPDWMADSSLARRGFHKYAAGIPAAVAETLGLEEQAVVDAIHQARKEMRLENLNQAVEDGRLTQEHADANADREGGLTLESLSIRVRGMSQDFIIAKRQLRSLNARIASLEAEIAALKAGRQNEPVNRRCVVGSWRGAELDDSPRLQRETLKAFRSEFPGGTLAGYFIHDVIFHPQGETVWVRYKALMDGRVPAVEIIERWQGCEFAGFHFAD